MELRQRNERRESDIEVVRMMPAPGEDLLVSTALS